MRRRKGGEHTSNRKILKGGERDGKLSDCSEKVQESVCV